ncbi:MAG: hypothetical protein CBC01_04505 [Betaproteobacteria bacterium TMED41]|nr:MAG: hypothetical protein CBC01_04505 [Betaproteobacteria bacterium TMED41]
MQDFDKTEITPEIIKDQLLKLHSRNLIDDKTFVEILNKLSQENNYEKIFFQELLKRFKERLDFKLERGMLNYLKKNLKE